MRAGAPPPPPDLVCFQRFWHKLKGFLVGHAADVVVAVHCRHGCNKTGAMLVTAKMIAEGRSGLGDLEWCIAEFARARSAQLGPEQPPLGMYDPDALWCLYRWFGFLPTVHARETTCAIPPHRMPKRSSAGQEAYSASSSRNTVPIPSLVTALPDFASVGAGGSRRDKGIFNPVAPVGLCGEVISNQLLSSSLAANEALDHVQALLIRANTLTRGADLAGFCNMPHELRDPSLIRATHVASFKPDGDRVQVVITDSGTYVKDRLGQVGGGPSCGRAALQRAPLT